jgi:hypothetical protein
VPSGWRGMAIVICFVMVGQKAKHDRIVKKL